MGTGIHHMQSGHLRGRVLSWIQKDWKREAYCITNNHFAPADARLFWKIMWATYVYLKHLGQIPVSRNHYTILEDSTTWCLDKKTHN